MKAVAKQKTKDFGFYRCNKKFLPGLKKTIINLLYTFFISNFYKQRQAEIGKKLKAKQHPEAELLTNMPK